MCWRCGTRPGARLRLRPWKRGTLCRPCGREIDAVLVDVLVVVYLLNISK
jgi:hypothetical protein